MGLTLDWVYFLCAKSSYRGLATKDERCTVTSQVCAGKVRLLAQRLFHSTCLSRERGLSQGHTVSSSLVIDNFRSYTQRNFN